MKLSEAIRLGSMLKPQAYHSPIHGLPISMNSKTCALAAACEAVGVETLNVYAPQFVQAFGDRWFDSRFTNTPCPVCHSEQASGGVITHLNDEHMWPREQIADWVETIERAQEQPLAETVELSPVLISTAASPAQKS